MFPGDEEYCDQGVVRKKKKLPKEVHVVGIRRDDSTSAGRCRKPEMESALRHTKFVNDDANTHVLSSDWFSSVMTRRPAVEGKASLALPVSHSSTSSTSSPSLFLLQSFCHQATDCRGRQSTSCLRHVNGHVTGVFTCVSVDVATERVDNKTLMLCSATPKKLCENSSGVFEKSKQQRR
ncbi:Hypothetical protein SMAX5B_010710 [Scophthalmus maximus]|uniref:Uncharacterized protein n=1 Tax=Scophthalmus maximus TaxID=52904 RepID=A0A2U9B6F0_SCOMX|nr:Hypothetical protein SMAX5B_010710 [Scophthalmus maximus]